MERVEPTNYVVVIEGQHCGVPFMSYATQEQYESRSDASAARAKWFETASAIARRSLIESGASLVVRLATEQDAVMQKRQFWKREDVAHKEQEDTETKVVEILNRPYTWLVETVGGEEGFSGSILEFPGCFACGETDVEARENLQRAAVSWVMACLEQGLEIPAPRDRAR